MSTSAFRLAVPVAAATAIFLLDLLTPNGLAIPVLYAISLLIALRWTSDAVVLTLAVICSVLTVVGAIIASSSGDSFGPVVINRALALVIIWGVAIALLQRGTARAGQAAAEAGRLHAEDFFRMAVESAPTGMLVVNEKGTIELVNEQIERQFGYQRNELIGRSVEILVPERHRGQHPENRARFLAHPESRPMGRGRDLFGLRKDGSEFPVEIGLNPIRMGDALRVLAVVVDITERKMIQERLHKTERLAELGTLASGMAHEIGTPMNVILGRAEYLMHRTSDEATRKGLSTIVTQVERITKVMNQLLAVARRRPTERRAVNLGQTIENNLEMVQERLARHKIQVEIAFSDSIPIILADADHMTQVFLNLIMNAIHAMPEGGVLRVGLARADGQARITVADTGHGIPPEDLPKIFDAFFTTKETGKGTGLGLTVVKGIIEEHGGTITAESEPGHGTTFTITLPLEGSSP